MIREALHGLGIVALNDPAPGPGVPSSLSGSRRDFGQIRLVGSMGKARAATYLAIYHMNPWVYAAVNAISRSVARLPLHVYQLDVNADKQRQRSDIPQTPGRPSAGVQLDRILVANADGLSRQAFYASTLRDRLIHGNALWEIVTAGAGLPTGLRHISWRNVFHVEEDGWGRPLYYEIAETGRLASTSRKLLPNDVVHFGLGAESGQACNVSILDSCQHTLALHEAVMRHLMAYLENSARGSGHFKVENEKQAAQARQMITELYTSPENAGKVLVTNAEWVSMADSPDHAQIVELVKESRTEIAGAYGVPPTELGLLENAIRANVKEMREKMGRDTIGPWASEFEGELQAQLLAPFPAWSSMFTEFALGELLRPDLEARALVYQRMSPILTIDEIRRMENLPPLNLRGVTDVPWAASGMLPLTTAARQQPRGQQPPAAGARAEHVTLDQARALVLALEHEHQNGNGHHELSEVT